MVKENVLTHIQNPGIKFILDEQPHPKGRGIDRKEKWER